MRRRHVSKRRSTGSANESDLPTVARQYSVVIIERPTAPGTHHCTANSA